MSVELSFVVLLWGSPTHLVSVRTRFLIFFVWSCQADEVKEARVAEEFEKLRQRNYKAGLQQER